MSASPSGGDGAFRGQGAGGGELGLRVDAAGGDQGEVTDEARLRGDSGVQSELRRPRVELSPSRRLVGTMCSFAITVGTPSRLTPPAGFGISTRLTGCGL